MFIIISYTIMHFQQNIAHSNAQFRNHLNIFKVTQDITKGKTAWKIDKEILTAESLLVSAMKLYGLFFINFTCGGGGGRGNAVTTHEKKTLSLVFAFIFAFYENIMSMAEQTIYILYFFSVQSQNGVNTFSKHTINALLAPNRRLMSFGKTLIYICHSPPRR